MARNETSSFVRTFAGTRATPRTIGLSARLTSRRTNTTGAIVIRASSDLTGTQSRRSSRSSW